jgi:hypothetical protein
MFWEQIAKTWMRRASKTAASRRSAPQIGPERQGLILGETPVDDLDTESQTRPYTPGNSARLGESSLHLSC